LSRVEDPRFPVRISVLKDGEVWLRLRAQSGWPGAGTQVFCLRDSAALPAHAEEVERARLIAVKRMGARLTLVFDRRSRRRCDFLFVSRSSRGDPQRRYEQIFWQTQQALVQRRPKLALPALRSAAGFTVWIASEERYPWRFPGCRVERRRLPAGDYALVEDGRQLAVVERKTFENLLADLGVIPLLRQRLLDLSAQANSALVVEAAYEDFLSSRKLHHYTPAFCAAAIADLYASLPALRIVFCGNRKTANAWTRAFFSAVLANHRGQAGASAWPP